MWLFLRWGEGHVTLIFDCIGFLAKMQILSLFQICIAFFFYFEEMF